MAKGRAPLAEHQTPRTSSPDPLTQGVRHKVSPKESCAQGHKSMPSSHSRRTGWTETPPWPEDPAPGPWLCLSGEARKALRKGPALDSGALSTGRFSQDQHPALSSGTLLKGPQDFGKQPGTSLQGQGTQHPMGQPSPANRSAHSSREPGPPGPTAGRGTEQYPALHPNLGV